MLTHDHEIPESSQSDQVEWVINKQDLGELAIPIKNSNQRLSAFKANSRIAVDSPEPPPSLGSLNVKAFISFDNFLRFI